ncbi:2-vinyl bacteriochlorophyllide hydratase [Roseateles sp. SL47]|uniref:2-vinyl bacteriochlorophyllide hydratase n=1 Tax=Roseateles sp. SL47 TaxID=2995138 RepID=UPI00226E0669|nr:2-vinyl bacteriochlorophyllide hydratase [Roseateles sp. SL47]WAC73215.1 2-vinyl bacteriochlorophyllide hydratase [Roseateles sp. SL47]
MALRHETLQQPHQEPHRLAPDQPRHPALYTPEERARRDATRWTLVQGVLAPVQFLVFLVSLVLVLRFLVTGAGEQTAAVSVLIKTLLLYTIMVTGCIWEKVVFNRWLFAPAFFWEDVFSMAVLALHTGYLMAWFTGWLDSRSQMLLALAAYAAYAINATQFVLKLRAARLQGMAGAPDVPADLPTDLPAKQGTSPPRSMPGACS